MSLIKRKHLIIASKAAKMRGCSVRSLKRYDANPDDDFPKSIIDRGHMKWVEREVEEWLERRLAARDKEQAAVGRVLRAVG